MNQKNSLGLNECFLDIDNPIELFKIWLNKANKQLIGKIVNEHSIFYGGDDESKMKRHDFLALEVKQWFIDMFKHYLDFNFIKEYDLHLNSIFCH